MVFSDSETHYSPERARKLQDELDRRGQQEQEIDSIESPFLRVLTRSLAGWNFALAPLTLEGLMHEERLLRTDQIRVDLERNKGYAYQEADALNEKYNRLLAQAKEGIAKIKALDENQEASGLCTEAMAGARAILELCQFEDQYLGMRQSPPEADRSDAP